MKTKLLILLFFISKAVIISGQNNDKAVTQNSKKNSVFIEGGGNGFLGSVNYDRITGPIFEKLKISFRIGIGQNIVPFSYSPTLPIAPLVELNLLFGKEKHYFETGFGVNFSSSTDDNYYGFHSTSPKRVTTLFPYETFRLGYRYQKPNGGLFFRAAFTPNFGSQLSGFFWIGVSLGYSF